MPISDLPSFARLEETDPARLLVESSKLFSRAFDKAQIHEILEHVVRSCMSCNGLLVSSYESVARLIRCEYAWVDGRHLDVSLFPPLSLETDPGKGMQSEVIRTGEVRFFRDVQEVVEDGKGTFYDVDKEGNVTDLPKGRRPSTQAAIMAPVKLDEGVIGVVQVMTEDGQSYTDDHCVLVEGLAIQIGIALKNADMFAHMQAEISERIRAEEALRERELQVNHLNTVLEERVAERTAELQRAIGELESFCYSVSHDLRQPLRGICASSAILLQEHRQELSSEAGELLRSLTEASLKMSRLIDALLRFSRLGRAPMRRRHVNLSVAAGEVVVNLVKQTEYVGEVEVQPDLTCEGDSEMLELLVYNLISNAMKFASKAETPKVSFWADEEGREPVFHVGDNGAGFDPAYAKKLFKPFERLHREEEFPGVGIGLAIAKQIVERHGGRIWADGTPGSGATFHFTLG